VLADLHVRAGKNPAVFAQVSKSRLGNNSRSSPQVPAAVIN